MYIKKHISLPFYKLRHPKMVLIVHWMALLFCLFLHVTF